MLKRDPVVSYVIDTKTEEIGPRIFRFKAEVAWVSRQARAAMASSTPAKLSMGLVDSKLDPDWAAAGPCCPDTLKALGFRVKG